MIGGYSEDIQDECNWMFAHFLEENFAFIQCCWRFQNFSRMAALWKAHIFTDTWSWVSAATILSRVPAGLLAWHVLWKACRCGRYLRLDASPSLRTRFFFKFNNTTIKQLLQFNNTTNPGTLAAPGLSPSHFDSSGTLHRYSSSICLKSSRLLYFRFLTLLGKQFPNGWRLRFAL